MPKRRPKFSPLIPVQLTQVTTSDGVDLAGVVVEPKGPKRAALIWLHGLTSSFDSGQTLMQLLSRACIQQGIGYFKFNNRGHHIADWGPRHMEGAAFERFHESPKDIQAVIALARRRGYRKIILAGHSTGANKVVHYVSRYPSRNIIGVLLAGPVSDIAWLRKKLGPRRLVAQLQRATRTARHQPNTVVSMDWGMLSAQRYVSLYTPNLPEDTFPWYNPKARWRAMRKIRAPLFVVFGSKDEFLDQPAARIVSTFRTQANRTRHFNGIVIPGSRHGFRGHQPELTRHINRWLKTVI